MERLTAVLERADEVMDSNADLEKIEFPALREVMTQVASSRDNVYGYSRHSDHSKTSTKGCAMGCVGG